MALPASPLSKVCKEIRDHLISQIQVSEGSKLTVVLGTPADAASTDAADSTHRLNLFFFRFEPAGLFPDTLPGETGWLRGFCLITPFACDESVEGGEEPVDGSPEGAGTTIGAGENDLRLIGEVVRVFHEKPVFRCNVNGQDYHVQTIFQPLALDQLNQLWSTQGETIYRPSVLYEVSLAPVIPNDAARPSPLTGSFGLTVQADLDASAPPASPRTPEVPRMTPNIAQPDWTPAIALVHGDACGFSFSFALGSQALADFVPRVWLAGKPGDSVTLRWQTWEAANGWQTVNPGIQAIIQDASIDPASVADASTQDLALPFDDRSGQMLLHAEREYVRASDGVTLTVRSNPLLISLYTG
ncbi:MAG: DUF4255 domain-containing protein [Verrucomicrobiae bacterium]|nr:DUF4255 domain-containing protein [Verrucomicrobiae bacterium]MCP5524226.1 DUF4255 domain-containing protein [Verrucomicrobiales bacterium]